MANKYWIGKEPNSNVTAAQAQKLAELSATTATVEDLNSHSKGVAVADATGITTYTAVTNMANPVAKAEGEAVSAALATLQSEVTLLTATVNALIASLEVSHLETP